MKYWRITAGRKSTEFGRVIKPFVDILSHVIAELIYMQNVNKMKRNKEVVTFIALSFITNALKLIYNCNYVINKLLKYKEKLFYSRYK